MGTAKGIDFLSGIPLSEVFDATSAGNVRRPSLVLVTNLALKIVRIMLLCMLSHWTSLIGKGKRSTNITETVRFIQATPMHGCRREMKMRFSKNDKFFNDIIIFHLILIYNNIHYCYQFLLD